MKVIVIGRNYVSRLSAIRALGKAGYQVDVIATNRTKPKGIRAKWRMMKSNPDYSSKYVHRFLFAKEPDKEALITQLETLKSKSQNRIAIFPVDDYAASVLDLEAHRLGKDFIFPNIKNTPGAIVQAMDKMEQKKAAQSKGLLTAKGWTIHLEDGNYNIPSDIEYPCFTKPEISFQGSKTIMRRCECIEDLENTLKQLPQQGKFDVLVEQYIQIDVEYGVLGYCIGKNVQIPCLVEKKKIGHGAHAGVTMLGKVTRFDLSFPEFYMKLNSFLEDLDYTGMVDVDLYESNGQLYFNELNLRAGAFSYAAFLLGYNFPQVVVKALTERDSKPIENLQSESFICLSEKVAWDDVVAGFMTEIEYKKLYETTQGFFIKDQEDKRPEVFFKLSHLKSR